jgi:hypothetical protein
MKITILIGILFILSRIYIGMNFEPDSFSWLAAYKDAAHIFMGSLGACWWIQRHKWQWNLFWLLNFVEVSVAIWSRL